MSEVKFSCPGCNQHIACDESYAGTEINCPSCQAAMVVPGKEPPPESGHQFQAPGCPGCGSAILPGAVICTNCGLNQQTGQRIPAPGKSTPPARSSRRPATAAQLNRNAWLGVVLAIFVVALLSGLFNRTAYLHTVFMVGFLLTQFLGGLWLLVVAYQESPWWALGSMFVPFVAPIFVVIHWKEAKEPFLVQLAGWGILLLGVIFSS